MSLIPGNVVFLFVSVLFFDKPTCSNDVFVLQISARVANGMYLLLFREKVEV